MGIYDNNKRDTPGYLSDFLTDIESYQGGQVATLQRVNVISPDDFFNIAKGHVREDNGKTVLHIAAELGDVDCLELLLGNKEINPFILDHSGETPFDIAKRLYPEDLPVINAFINNHACINQKFDYKMMNLTNAYVTGDTSSDRAYSSHHIYDNESLSWAMEKGIPLTSASLTLLAYRLFQYLSFIPLLAAKLNTPPHYQKLRSIRKSIENLLSSDYLKDIPVNEQAIVPPEPIIAIVSENKRGEIKIDESEEDILIPIPIFSLPEQGENKLDELAEEASEGDTLIQILRFEEQLDLLDRLYKARKQNSPFVNFQDVLIWLKAEKDGLAQLYNIKQALIVDTLKNASWLKQNIGALSPHDLKKIAQTTLSILCVLLIIGSALLYLAIYLGIILLKSSSDFVDHTLRVIFFIFFNPYLFVSIMGSLACSPCIVCILSHKFIEFIVKDNLTQTPFNERLTSDDEIRLTEVLQEHLTDVFGIQFSDKDRSKQIGWEAILAWATKREAHVDEKLSRHAKSLAQNEHTFYYRAPPNCSDPLGLIPSKSAANGK